LKTDGPRYSRFLVLIPHRDAGRVLREYRRRLFAAGFWGAWSFPGLVPLAPLSRPLPEGELKTLARRFREASLEGGRGGWFRFGRAEALPLPGQAPGGLSLYGPLLDLSLPAAFPRLVLAAALVKGDPAALPAALPAAPPMPEPPPLAFRAAAVANMVLRPLPGGDRDFSFEWRLGKPVWLPALR
jgi:hypothetical protein